MKQRVTFLVKPDSPPTDPEQFKLSLEALQVKGLHAARQERWTISADELPTLVQNALASLPELHIKWSTKSAYRSLDPFSTRAPAGLHVLTPSVESTKDIDLICPLLGTVFGPEAGCVSVSESFIEIPQQRYQYYTELSDVSTFVSYIQKYICNGKEHCLDESKAIGHADYFDIDYQGPGSPLVFSAFWSTNSVDDGPWTTTLRKHFQDHRVEVGILDQRAKIYEEKLTFGGILGVIGETEEFKETMFSFHPRHQHNYGVYAGTFHNQTGLHPKFALSIQAGEPPEEECNLNAYFTLPKTFFVDKYQLADQQLLHSLGLNGFKGPYGEADLEAPVWTQSRWGSSFLLQIATPENTTEPLQVELPLHLRYLEPASGGNNIPVEMPWPVIFWACPSTVWQKFHTSPFDRKNIGYEHMFGEDTVYHHLSPQGPVTFSTLGVPVLDLDHASMIKMGTAGLVLLGFLYIVAKILLNVGGRGKTAKLE
ncbi:PIG-X [Peziza echinospora]|nr:PIG-X [Peziza echinospora]